MTVAADLGVPRSTVVVCLDVADLTESELRQEILKLRRRIQKLTALLRLALALLRTSGFSFTGARLPDGRAKLRILRAVDRDREHLPLRAVLRFLRASPSRFHAWPGGRAPVRSTISPVARQNLITPRLPTRLFHGTGPATPPCYNGGRMLDTLALVLRWLRALCRSRGDLALENLATTLATRRR